MSSLPTRPLGSEDLDVTVICLGGWPLGGGMGAIDESQAIRVVHAALDAGVNFIDTAEGYKTSEAVIGKALSGKRDQVVLATKLSGEHSPEYIQAAIDGSLRKLQTDYVDLYQLHRPSENWPIAETLAVLTRLKDEGKIKHIGVSNFTLAQLEEAIQYGVIASVQPQYSMIFRSAEKTLFPFCAENHIGVMTYGPIARGLLSGKYKPSHKFSKDDDRATHASLTDEVRVAAATICERLAPLARDQGFTMAQLAIAWTIANKQVSTTICGAKTPEQIVENCKAGSWRLSDADKFEIQRLLDEVVPNVPSDA